MRKGTKRVRICIEGGMAKKCFRGVEVSHLLPCHPPTRGLSDKEDCLVHG